MWMYSLISMDRGTTSLHTMETLSEPSRGTLLLHTVSKRPVKAFYLIICSLYLFGCPCVIAGRLHYSSELFSHCDPDKRKKEKKKKKKRVSILARVDSTYKTQVLWNHGVNMCSLRVWFLSMARTEVNSRLKFTNMSWLICWWSFFPFLKARAQFVFWIDRVFSYGFKQIDVLAQKPEIHLEHFGIYVFWLLLSHSNCLFSNVPVTDA